MKLTRLIAIVIHLGIAAVALTMLYSHYRQRADDVANVRHDSEIERKETQRIEHDVSVEKEILGGIRDGDPFVVEYLARERMDLTRPGELSPPPLTTVDKADSTPNK